MVEAMAVCACKRSSLVGYDLDSVGREYVFFRPRLFYQRHVRLFTNQNIRTCFGHSQKIEIDKALTLEHYTRNNVFVSRERIIASWHPGQQSKLSARDR